MHPSKAHDVALTLLQRCLDVSNVVTTLKERCVVAGILLSYKYNSSFHILNFLIRFIIQQKDKGKVLSRRQRRCSFTMSYSTDGSEWFHYNDPIGNPVVSNEIFVEQTDY